EGMEEGAAGRRPVREFRSELERRFRAPDEFVLVDAQPAEEQPRRGKRFLARIEQLVLAAFDDADARGVMLELARKRRRGRPPREPAADDSDAGKFAHDGGAA